MYAETLSSVLLSSVLDGRRMVAEGEGVGVRAGSVGVGFVNSDKLSEPSLT